MNCIFCDITVKLISLNIFQYSWNSNELYLFRATIAYAMKQYYTSKNESLPFTLVFSSTWFWILCFPLTNCCYNVCFSVGLHMQGRECPHVQGVSQNLLLHFGHQPKNSILIYSKVWGGGSHTVSIIQNKCILIAYATHFCFSLMFTDKNKIEGVLATRSLRMVLLVC